MGYDHRDRITKLLKLTAADSGATPAEQAAAALEIARLLQKLEMFQEDTRRRPEPPRRPVYDVPDEPPPVYDPFANWTRVAAPHVCTCSACGRKISRGDIVWWGNGAGPRHNYGSCCPQAEYPAPERTGAR